MSFKPAAYKLKNLIREKGTIDPDPANSSEVIVVKESQISNSYTLSVAVGLSSNITGRYFDVRGRVLDDTFNRFNHSTLRIEKKTDITKNKGEAYLCGVFKPGLIRQVDEASWNQKFESLSDLIEVLEHLGENPSDSIFKSLTKPQ